MFQGQQQAVRHQRHIAVHATSHTYTDRCMIKVAYATSLRVLTGIQPADHKYIMF